MAETPHNPDATITGPGKYFTTPAPHQPTIEETASHIVDKVISLSRPSSSPYTAPGRKGWLSGNPGRQKGSVNKRRQSALDLFDQYGFDPLESKIVLCQALEHKLQAGE